MARTLRSLAAAGIAALLLVPVAASAQDIPALQARIRQVSFDSDGNTRVVAAVSGTAVAGATLDASAFSLTENGDAVSDLSARPLFDDGAANVAVELLVDVSASTAGRLDQAKSAAVDFIQRLPDEVRVGVISFGSKLTTAIPPTPLAAARNEVIASISGLETDSVRNITLLHDGVIAGAAEIARVADAQRNIVVFSDGVDANSKATLTDAIQAVKNVGSSVTTILLAGTGIDEQPLRALANVDDAGAFLRADDPGALAGLFNAVAQAISSQYVLTYPSDDTDATELVLDLTVSVASESANDNTVVINRRQAVAPAPGAVGGGLIADIFGSAIGLYVGIFAAFAGVALFIGMLIWSPSGKRAERMLQRRLRLYSRSERAKEKERVERSQAGGVFSGTGLGRRAVELAERLPRSKAWEEKVQKQLDRAGWALRSSEFVLIQVGAALIGLVLGWALFSGFWYGLVIAIFATLVPRAVLANRVAKRSSAFLEQLPDTLQLLAGSLSAGYGFLQALDTVAKEAIPPTSTEYSRVLAEARLGMPVEEALDDMADRVGGDDFKWVVLAINIQRQVGGNLAQLLTTVAQTLREREQVRRQIKVLSAEGRLSAVILVALPFVLFGYLRLINPQYIGQLTASTPGKIAIVMGLALIAVGAAWMRKIIRIEV